LRQADGVVDVAQLVEETALSSREVDGAQSGAQSAATVVDEVSRSEAIAAEAVAPCRAAAAAPTFVADNPWHTLPSPVPCSFQEVMHNREQEFPEPKSYRVAQDCFCLHENRANRARALAGEERSGILTM
jgi:hypothetical protein